MAIASAVFWIALGVCYIVYQGFKEHPKETMIALGSLAAIVCCGLLIHALSIPFSELDEIFVIIFELAVSVSLLYLLLKKRKKDRKKADEKFEVVLHKAKREEALRRIARHLAENEQDLSD